MSDVIQAAVERLSRVPGVRGAMVVDAEAGVPVAAELTPDVRPTALAALTSSFYRRSREAARGAGYGRLGMLQLEADAGHLVVGGGETLLVVVVAERDAQLGMVRLETQRATKEVVT